MAGRWAVVHVVSTGGGGRNDDAGIRTCLCKDACAEECDSDHFGNDEAEENVNWEVLVG
jgi:hypothetical protein